MNRFACAALCLGLFALGAIGVAQIHSQGIRNVGATLLQLPLAEDEMRQALDREERIEIDRVQTFSRLEAKRRLVEALARGRLDLMEAAARLRDLDNPKVFWVTLRRYEKGGSDEERLCRHLIDLAKEELAGTPAEAEAVGERLEREVEARLDCLGRIDLPK